MLHASLIVVTLLAAPAERPAVAVLGLTPAGGVEEGVASAMTESVAIELSTRGVFQVITEKDVQTLLGMERQKQLLGCGEDSSSCLTELAGAIGARFVLSGSLARLGDAYQLNLQMMDSQTARPVGRSTRIASDLGELRKTLAWAVAEATGIPPPAAPSRLVPYSLIGAGSALLVGGGVVGLQAWSQEEGLIQELRLGSEGRAQLDSLEAYQDRADRAAREKTIGLSAAALGAGLVLTGVLINSAIDGPAQVALFPTSNGVAFAGVFE